MSRSVRRHLGQLVIAGFAGTTPPVELRAVAREFDLGGVILFSRNVEAPAQVAELAYDVQSLAHDLPLWVSVDQEGGRVARLREPFTVWPPMQTLGRSGRDDLAERYAAALARELRTVGITLDYAPVLDVHTNPRNPVIGDRALSSDPEVVARLGEVVVRGLQGGGVAACAKHFPGHGETEADSHHELPTVDLPPDRLDAIELRPFRQAVAADVAMVMTAHVRYPAWDETGPATVSRTIVTEILRQRLAYTGVVATDDMSMQGVLGDRTLDQATVDALAAGCDLILLCAPDVDQQVSALEAVIRAIEEERLPLARLEDALARGRRAKERFLGDVPRWRPPTSAELTERLGADAHQATADEMRMYA